uniref:Keratin n=2 Tax=Gallus gallus TaxID=9031 RepID=A0A8V1AL19_CHICK
MVLPPDPFCFPVRGEVGEGLGLTLLGLLGIWAAKPLAVRALPASAPQPVPPSLASRLLLMLCVFCLSPLQVDLHPTTMSCFDLCRPCGPTPLANSCNEPCVRQCQDSRVVIEPSPVVVTLPGPILSSFPQNTAVGSSTSAAVGSILSEEGVPISSGGFGLSGLGGRFSGRRCLPY